MKRKHKFLSMLEKLKLVLKTLEKGMSAKTMKLLWYQIFQQVRKV